MGTRCVPRSMRETSPARSLECPIPDTSRGPWSAQFQVCPEVAQVKVISQSVESPIPQIQAKRVVGELRAMRARAVRVQSGFAFPEIQLQVCPGSWGAFFERTGSSGTPERVRELRQQSDQGNNVCVREIESVKKTRVHRVPGTSKPRVHGVNSYLEQ